MSLFSDEVAAQIRKMIEMVSTVPSYEVWVTNIVPDVDNEGEPLILKVKSEQPLNMLVPHRFPGMPRNISLTGVDFVVMMSEATYERLDVRFEDYNIATFGPGGRPLEKPPKVK